MASTFCSKNFHHEIDRPPKSHIPLQVIRKSQPAIDD